MQCRHLICGLMQVRQAAKEHQRMAQQGPEFTQQLHSAPSHLDMSFDALTIEDDDAMCVICLERPQTEVLAPCCHCVTCEACTKMVLQSANPLCPYCRTAIESHFSAAF